MSISEKLIQKSLKSQRELQALKIWMMLWLFVTIIQSIVALSVKIGMLRISHIFYRIKMDISDTIMDEIENDGVII
jgi:hypothetical protein